MRTIVDTCSLVRMAQSYQPFDSTDTLASFLRIELENGALIFLDKVAEETRYTAQGIAYHTFECLQNKKFIRSTEKIFPTPRFYRMLDNNFVDKSYKKLKLGGNENAYQNEREKYLQGADCAMIVYALQEQSFLEPIQILTEESFSLNDNKLFYKIPVICKPLKIPTVNTVQYFKQHEDDLTVEVRSAK